MFNESMNDFYKNQTFYKAAKSYAPELKKQIIAFLRKKGVNEYKGNPSFSYDNLPDKEDKSSLFHGLYKNIEVDDKTGDRFNTKLPTFKKISFPKFVYDNFEIKPEINNNETFFEDGHDLFININKLDGGYETIRKFDYKLNLLRNVNIVLEDFWSLILKSIKDYTLTEKPKYSSDNGYREPSSPTPSTIIRKWLGTYFKEYKSGKKVEIDDVAKQPAEFFITTNDSDKDFSSIGRKGQGFTLKFKVRLLNKNFEKSSSWINPELKNRYPQYKEWIGIYNKFHKEMGYASYEDIDEKKLFGEKSYSDEHMKIFERLKMVVKRLYKMGYLPTRAGDRDRNDYYTIKFEYNPELPEILRLNPAKIDLFLSSEKFKDKITSSFFHAGTHPNDVLHNLLIRVFNTKRK